MSAVTAINNRELELGAKGSWHDQYKDSAYIYVGGLHFDLTEGDVITIFSQYGEVMDVNLPRDKETGKTRGFGFLMYEDQRSTILAVDNLNGAKVLDRTLRVDHVQNYKQKELVDGEWKDREEPSLNAKPELVIDDGAASDSSVSSAPSIDPEDPMRDYLLAKRKEAKGKKKEKKSKSKHANETPEERRERKARKREKKRLAAERNSTSLEVSSKGARHHERHRERTGPNRERSRSPPRRSERDHWAKRRDHSYGGDEPRKR